MNGVATHELKYVHGNPQYRYEAYMAPPGTMTTYLGTMRVVELDSKGHELRPMRHVFLLGATRVMAVDLRDFTPVT